MRRLFLICLLALSAIAGTATAQTTTIDLIPSDATAAILLRHPNELKKKGDKFLKDADLDFGIRPTQLLDMVTDFLDVRAGIDWDRPAGAVLLRPLDDKTIGLRELERNLYVVVPFSDLDEMAGNWGLAKGKLKADKVTAVEGRVKHVLVQGKNIYVAADAEPLERLLKAKGISAKLSAEQKKSYGKADILALLAPKGFQDDWNSSLANFERDFDKLEDPQEKAAVAKLVKSLASLEFSLFGVHIGDGAGLSILAHFDKESAAPRDLLDSIRGDKRGSDLNGLAEGNVVVAQSYAGGGGKSAPFARAILNYFLKNVLELNQLTAATDRPAFAGIFNEVWQSLQGNRFAVYQTSDESKLGLFSLVAILDSPDPQKFIATMRLLSRMGEGTIDLTKKTAEDTVDIQQIVTDLGSERYTLRASATTKIRLLGEPALPYLKKAAASPDSSLEVIRRAEKLIVEIANVAAERRKELLAKDLPSFVRPTFAWVGKAEKRLGQQVDIVQIKLQEKDKGAAGAMKQYLGPDWDKVRLVVLDKQIVVLLGSETELFDLTLKNIQEGRPGLAGSKPLSAFAKLRPAGSAGEFHASLGTLAGLFNGGNEVLRNHDALSSVALIVGEANLQVNLFVPMAEFRLVGKMFR